MAGGAHGARVGQAGRFRLVAIAAALLLAVAPAPRTVAVQAAPGAALTVLPNGQFYTEANGRGGVGGSVD
jgi:hypothetical protein